MISAISEGSGLGKEAAHPHQLWQGILTHVDWWFPVYFHLKLLHIRVRLKQLTSRRTDEARQDNNGYKKT